MGFGEILVIGVVALLVIGPKQLPQVARVVGRLFGEFKKATEDLSGGLMSATREAKDALHKATDFEELTRVPGPTPPPPPNPDDVMDFDDDGHHHGDHAHDPDHEHESLHDDHEENFHPPLDDHDSEDK